MASRLYEKVYGSLIGGAIGDAIGAPVECMHFRDIAEQFGWVEDFLEYVPRPVGGGPPYETHGLFDERRMMPSTKPHPFGAWRLEAGVYTDDTRFRILALQGYLKRGGRMTGWEFAEDVIDYRSECS